MRYPLTAAPHEQGVVVAGRVRMGAAKGAMQTIEIVWAVRRADGTEIGKLTQNNTVPAGTLDRSWGRLADIIAQNAAGGLADLLKKASAAAPK